MSERYQLLPLFALSKLPPEHGKGKFIKKKTFTRGSHCHVWVPGGEFYPMDEFPEFHDGGHQLDPDWCFQLSSIITHKDRNWRCLFHSCTIQRRLWLKLRFGQFFLLEINKIFMDFPRRNDWIVCWWSSKCVSWPGSQKIWAISEATEMLFALPVQWQKADSTLLQQQPLRLVIG